MKTLLIVLVAVIAFFLWLPTPDAPPVAFAETQQGNGFVLRDVRVFDGEQFHARRDVVVQDGIITAISPRTPAPDGLPEFDGSGHTLLPGLIDAHTHNFTDSRREALRFGVTIQLDMFSSATALPAARAEREALTRTDLADMWSAGTLVTAPGGHGTQFGLPIPTLGVSDDVDAFIAARVAEGSDFIKLVLEDGAAWESELATLDAPTLAAAIAAAHTHGKLAVVHIGSRDEALVALQAGADGLVHLFGDREMDDEVVALARANDAFVIPTLAVLESISGQSSGLQDDPALQSLLTPNQLGTLSRGFPRAESRSDVFANAAAGVRRLHESGVAILAGSDAPNPGTAHGISLYRELELLVEAGMSPAAALAAATSVPASRFGLENRGRIAAGMRADMVLVEGDPAQDITATRAIVAVWKNGYVVPRPVVAARTEAAVLEDPVLGRFDGGDDDWIPTTDSMQGGESTVTLAVSDGVLRVTGTVVTGAPWPWSGTMRMLSATPMAAVDLGALNTLSLRIRGDMPGSAQVLFFSGPEGQPIPAMYAVDYTTEWREVEIPFAAVEGLDSSAARAVAVVAGSVPGDFGFELDDVVLR